MLNFNKATLFISLSLVLNFSGTHTIPGNSSFISYEGRTSVTDDGTVRLGYPGIVTRVNFNGTDLLIKTRSNSDVTSLLNNV
jgi:hypothetical protein